MCINASQPEEPRVAVIDNQKLMALETQENDLNRTCGNIYLATITSIQSGIDAVFADFGSQRHGFLPFKEIASKYYQKEASDNTKISDLISVGQTVLVQVTREEKSNKGAALTTNLSLAGAYLVIMHNNQKNNGVSKKADANDRQKTKEMLSQLDIPAHLSIIVRTEGVNRSKDELAWDLDCLIHHWENIHEVSAAAKAPALIHQEADTLIRSVRDRLRKNIDSIVVDHEPTYEKLKTYLQLTRPEFAEKVTLYQNKVPIFTHFGIQNDINNLFMRKIQLPSGGSIVIDHCEAMTVIDVNSSKSTSAKNIEETALKTNVEAARELLRQLTLRDIGGIIAVDFIDMVSGENRKKVENVVEQHINTERAKIRFEKISDLTGCMYLSRQRTGPSILDQHYTECKHCSSLGFHRSILSLASAILFSVENGSVGATGITIVAQTSPDVACFILNEKRTHLENIEKKYNNTIIIVPNDHYIDSKYTIKRLNELPQGASYQQREEIEPSMKWHNNNGNQSNPLVPQNLYREHPKQSPSAIQRFMNIILPAKDGQPKVYNSAKKPEIEQKQENDTNHKRPQRRRSRSANQTRRQSSKQGHGQQRQDNPQGQQRQDNHQQRSRDTHQQEARQDGNQQGSRQDGNQQGSRQDGNQQGSRQDGNQQGSRQDGNQQGSRQDGNQQGSRQDGNQQGSRQDGNQQGSRQDGHQQRQAPRRYHTRHNNKPSQAAAADRLDD